MTRKFRLGWVAALVVSLGAAVWAGQGAPAGGDWAAEAEAMGLGLGVGGKHPLLECFRDGLAKLRALKGQLSLTPEQKARIGAALRGRKAEVVALVKRVHDARRALQNAVRTEPVNEQTIRQAAGKVGDAVADGAVLWARVRAEVLAILTPEQRAKVEAVRKDIETSVDKAVDGLGK